MTAACPRRTGSGPSRHGGQPDPVRPLGKVVLARDLYATASEDIDVRVLLQRLADRYPTATHSLCAGLVGPRPSC